MTVAFLKLSQSLGIQPEVWGDHLSGQQQEVQCCGQWAPPASFLSPGARVLWQCPSILQDSNPKAMGVASLNIWKTPGGAGCRWGRLRWGCGKEGGQLDLAGVGRLMIRWGPQVAAWAVRSADCARPLLARQG